MQEEQKWFCWFIFDSLGADMTRWVCLVGAPRRPKPVEPAMLHGQNRSSGLEVENAMAAPMLPGSFLDIWCILVTKIEQVAYLNSCASYMISTCFYLFWAIAHFHRTLKQMESRLGGLWSSWKSLAWTREMERPIAFAMPFRLSQTQVSRLSPLLTTWLFDKVSTEADQVPKTAGSSIYAKFQNQKPEFYILGSEKNAEKHRGTQQKKQSEDSGRSKKRCSPMVPAGSHGPGGELPGTLHRREGIWLQRPVGIPCFVHRFASESEKENLSGALSCYKLWWISGGLKVPSSIASFHSSCARLILFFSSLSLYFDKVNKGMCCWILDVNNSCFCLDQAVQIADAEGGDFTKGGLDARELAKKTAFEIFEKVWLKMGRGKQDERPFDLCTSS